MVIAVKKTVLVAEAEADKSIGIVFLGQIAAHLKTSPGPEKYKAANSLSRASPEAMWGLGSNKTRWILLEAWWYTEYIGHDDSWDS